MKAIFLGATKGMGRALARRMARRGDELHLLGRDLDDLARSAADLAVDGARPSGVTACDLADPKGFGTALDEAVRSLGGRVDAVIVTAARFEAHDKLETDLELCRSLLEVDFTNTVLFCEEAKRRLLLQGGGVLCVFSSVAGERGRKPIFLYGAAKAGLTHYLEGLDHKYASQGLAVVTVKPGFVKTGPTAGLKPPPFAGEPEEVAARVLSAIDKRKPVVYAPAAWGPMMAVIRRLPRFVMRRVGF